MRKPKAAAAEGAGVLERVAIVLVEPHEAGNIGAAARAMANCGLSRLVLVRPAAFLVPDAFRMALAARPILEGAAVFEDLGEALAGFGFVAGTTRRGGAARGRRVSPRALAAEIPAVAAGGGEAAILFGREDSGLTNEELRYCQRLVTIASSDGFPSLNLAQAVMVLSHEIFLASVPGVPSPPARKLASTAELEGLFAQMQEVLLEIGYLHEASPARMMRVFRRLFGRAALDAREVRALRGIFRQAIWHAERCRGGSDVLE